MKNLIMTAIAILITTSSFADIQTSGFSKSGDKLKALGSAFKQHSTTTPKIDPNDITMGYAGQDVSNRQPIIVF